MIWSFALTPSGELHIVDGALPQAENVVVLEVDDWGQGLWVVDREALAPLRALLGQPSIREVVRHVGPVAADELEDALRRITGDLQRRIDILRGDDDDVVPGR
jgi:hypothetical protein